MDGFGLGAVHNPPVLLGTRPSGGYRTILTLKPSTTRPFFSAVSRGGLNVFLGYVAMFRLRVRFGMCAVGSPVDALL